MEALIVSDAEFRRLLTQDMLAEQMPCGPDVGRIAETIAEYEAAGVDELYIQQVGPDQEAFFTVAERDLLGLPSRRT